MKLIRFNPMKTKIILFLLTIALFSACDKTDSPSGIFIPANTRLCLTMKHHADVVEDTEVYLKLNTDEFPGYSGFAYDTLIMEAPNDGQVCIEGLVYGNYWAMAKGFDADWGDDVQGAIFFELTQFRENLDTVLVVNEF
jgi:hypothetical protein